MAAWRASPGGGAAGGALKRDKGALGISIAVIRRRPLCLRARAAGEAPAAAREATGRRPAQGGGPRPGAERRGGRPTRRAGGRAGHAARAAGAAARLPGVPVRVPLRAVQHGAAVVHPDAQPHPVRVPAQHDAAGPLHAQPQGAAPAAASRAAPLSHATVRHPAHGTVWPRTCPRASPSKCRSSKRGVLRWPHCASCLRTVPRAAPQAACE